MASNVYRIPDPITPKWYNGVYLKSRYWLWFRKRYMDTVEWRCETANCTRKAEVIHHLTYDNLFAEKREGVMALCRDCHAWMHKWPANDNTPQLELLFDKPKRASGED